MNSMYRSFSLWLLILTFFSFSILLSQGRMTVFGSFEDEAQVSSVKASEGVSVSSSTRFPAWRDHSLEVVFPATGGEIEFTQIPVDWRWRGALLLFVWSMQPGELDCVLADSAGNTFHKTFALKTGANHIQLKLSRPVILDLQRMRSVRLVSEHSGTFYLDYIALDRFHQVLEERGRFDVDYTMKVETPHVPWARPFVGGPIRAYALSGVIDGRAIIELAQRLELNFKATTMGISEPMNMYGFGDFYQQRRGGPSLIHTYIADDLLNGPCYDVILWPALRPWESYPEIVRENVRKRVERGAGLVIFYPLSQTEDGGGLWDISPLSMIKEYVRIWPEDPVELDSANVDKSPWRVTRDHYITRGVPLAAFPQGHLTVLASRSAGKVLIETEAGTPVLAVRSLGKGRVVAFGYSQRGMIPEVPDLWDTGLHYPYHEYMWSLVARSVVWAAGREPQASIGKMERTGNRVKVPLEGTPSGSELVARVMDSFGNVEKETRLSVPQGKKAMTLDLPEPLDAGRHFVDLRLVGGDGSLDWATLIVDETPGVSIQAITPQADRFQLGEKISGSVRLEADKKADCTVKLSLYDNYDRLIDECSFDTAVKGSTEHSFSFNTTGVLSHMAKIDCQVHAGGRLQDRRIAEVFVLQPRVWDDFDIVMYLFGPNPIPGIWPTIDSQMQRLWVTTLSSYPLDLCRHANYMVQAQTRVSGQESPDGGPDRRYYDEMKKKYLATRDKKVLVRKYCLNDPAYRELIRKELNRLASPWVPFSPLSYYVYEEPSLTCYGDAVDICFSEHCMREMRTWLKEQYGTLEALNSQWGTGFTRWEDVVPDDTYEAQARGNFSSWADHRTFMERTYANSYKMILEELRKLDPRAIVLNSGTQESASHNGCDYSQLNLYTKHLNAYQYEIHRSMNPEVKISGGAGYGVMGKDVFYNFYTNLFKGANGGLYVFWQYCTLDPDLTLNQSARDMEAGFQELRGEGIGKLVGLAFPDNHGIAVHYSYPSIHGAWIVDGHIEERVTYRTSRTFDRFNENLDGWLKILRDAGLQFDFMAYSAVEKGELVSKGYKTFILPMSVALSDEEIQAIREFVQAGGTVIADALPGVMDEHCRFRKSSALEELFGVEAPLADREKVIAMQGEPGLRLKAARAMLTEQKKPILVHNGFGRGQAWLLNYFLDSYNRDKREGRSEPALEKMKKVLTAAGIQPKVYLSSLAGTPVTGCDRYLFNNGSTKLLGLVPEMNRPEKEKIRIALDKSYAIYDVRDKRYLGAGAVFQTEIEPGVPKLFAFISSRISGMDIQAPAKAALGQEVKIDFRISGVPDLRSVAKVVVTDPAGHEVRIYGGNRDIVSASGSTSFRTALNDPAGDWYVEITEVMSGERSRAVVNIN